MTFVSMNQAALILAVSVFLVGTHSVVSYVGAPAKTSFKKENLPTDLSVVAAGGYNNVMKLADNPKAELEKLIISNLNASGGSSDYTESGKLDAIIRLLQSQGKGFRSVTVSGEWVPVLQRQGKKSQRIQKIVSKREKLMKAFSNFDVKSMEFENLAYTRRGNGLLTAVVKYNPVAKNFDKINGKIVLRRISCDITGASFKYWKFPKINLPLKRKGGFLDFLYLDDDIRITRGNRGGLFIHMRPEYVKKLMS